MGSLTWILIIITISILMMWMGFLYAAKRSQIKQVETIVLEEMERKGVQLTPDELSKATKQVLAKEKPDNSTDFLREKLMSLNQLPETTSTGGYSAAINVAQKRVNSQASKTRGSLITSSRARKVFVGFFVFSCIFLGLYIFVAVEASYYAYFVGALAVLSLLMLFNIWNTYFLIPLISCLALSGLLFGLGGREVLIASALQNGERLT